MPSEEVKVNLLERDAELLYKLLKETYDYEDTREIIEFLVDYWEIDQLKLNLKAMKSNE